MGTGYTRNDTANNIADGNVINASDLDGEFDAVQAAFNGTTGHSHDGTSGEGPQIGTGGIADSAVTTAKINDANVTLAKMAANSVDSDQYVDGSIDTAHIGNLQVTTAKIAADAIDGTKLADNAVDSEHYTDGSIDRVHLAADIVDGTKIADDSIDSEHYVDGSIDTAHIANDAVTGDKLANNIQIAGTLGVTGETTLTTHLNMGDNDIIKLGASADLQIYHDGANSIIYDAGAGNLQLASGGVGVDIQKAGGEKMATFAIDGAASLYYNNASKLATKSDGVDITGELQADSLDIDGVGDISGVLTLHSDLDMQDNDRIKLGDADDLQIYHNGTNSYIQDAGTGPLLIGGSGSVQIMDGGFTETMGYFEHNGAVTLYHNNSPKLATTSIGVNVTGRVVADSMQVEDTHKIIVGSSGDLEIYHDGSNSFINDVGTGNLRIGADTNVSITNSTNSTNYAVFNDASAVKLYYGGSKKFETKSDGVDITGELQSDSLDVDGNADISGTLTMGGHIDLQDNDKILLGSGDDLEIFHDAQNSYIVDIGTGNLNIRGTHVQIQDSSGNNFIYCNDTGTGGTVNLYQNASLKLNTATDGIYVTGNVQSSSGAFEGASNQDKILIGASQIDFYINNSNEFRMESDGDFHADGDVIAFSTTISDERLKTDIEKIENATDKVSQLNGYTFTYKADGKKSAGVIAQEVEKVLPSAVSEKELPLKMDDGVAYKTVQYDQIIGLLIESIKELKQEINELKKG